MRVGVYDGHLTTLGGGEQYALSIVRWILDQGHAVDVLAPPGISLGECEERLRLDLEGAQLVELAGPFPSCEEEATERSAGYDLFFNATHASRAPSRCAQSMLVVYFPLPLAELPALSPDELEQWTTTARAQSTCIHDAEGLHQPEAGGRWTDGAGKYVIGVGDRATVVEIDLMAPWPRSVARPTASFLLDGREAAQRRLSRRQESRVQLSVEPTDEYHQVLEIRSGSFSPATATGADDERTLGAFVRGISVGDTSAEVEQLEYGCALRFLDSYQHLVAVSRYAANWARRHWGTPIDTVVYPPVTPPPGRPPSDRARAIVVLGRFFGGPTSKKQLELVEAFTALCDHGLSDWELQLLGGVNDADYVERVRAAGRGYPVEVLADAPGPLVEERLGAATFAWQATGWGEDPAAHPDRFEHFGIALVEAMGAGAIPIALRTGGPEEIVADGKDGLLWDASDGPGRVTLSALNSPQKLVRLAAGARSRAEDFSRDNFEVSMARALSTSSPSAASTA